MSKRKPRWLAGREGMSEFVKYFFTKTKIILVDFFGGEDIIDISEKSEKSS